MWHLPPQLVAARTIHAPKSDTWHLPPPPVVAGTCRLGELAAKAQVILFYQFYSEMVLFGNSLVEVVLLPNILSTTT
jgi:hypothetical protein